MKRNTKMRIASLAMALLMLLSYMPFAANAVGSTDILAISKPTGISIVEDYDDYSAMIG